jgi:hypothetical protein
MAKITTQFTRWIWLPLLDYGTELVHVRSSAIIERMRSDEVKTQPLNRRLGHPAKVGHPGGSERIDSWLPARPSLMDTIS